MKSQKSPQTSSRGDKCLARFNSSNGSVYGTLTLDIRKAGDYSQPIPAAVRVCFNGQKVFLRLGRSYLMKEWEELCECEKTGRRSKQADRNEMKSQMGKIEQLINELIETNTFSLHKLQERYQGRKGQDSTIYTVLEEYIQTKTTDGRVGSARCSRDILNRFRKNMGTNVAFEEIDRDFILKWVKKMKDAELNSTSIGIGLRTFRTIVNICITQGLIKGDTKELFKDTGYNKSQSRKHEFLDVPTMRMLFDFWKKGEAKADNGSELFMPREKYAIFRDLGLFLFMYLGNGQNLADTLRLTYDGWYFSTHGKQMRFLRHKTRERNESASEVIFPITPELKAIIDKYGNTPKMGERVFPIMSEYISPEQEVWVIQRYNRYIREHMAKVAKILKMEQKPSPTWARHSYATNLNNSGVVPYKYISDSMGHSGNGDITSSYIGAYPLAKMLEYNRYLLNSEAPAAHKPDSKSLIEMLKGLSEEEKLAIISALSE